MLLFFDQQKILDLLIKQMKILFGIIIDTKNEINFVIEYNDGN
jgi:hypothetical protein